MLKNPGRVLAPLLLFGLAIAVRSLPMHRVLVGDSIQFFGNDAYYHMRRVLYSIFRFPDFLDFDPFLNFPHGAKAIWTPVFDWLVALVLLPLRGRPTADIEGVAVWIPPLLGALTVLALYAVARRHFGSRVAVLAGALLAISSGHFWYSQIGFIDHHCAVALVTTLLLGSAMAFFGRLGAETAAGRPPPQRDGRAMALGVWLAVSLLVWPGTLLHVGLLESAFLVLLLSHTDPVERWDLAARGVVIHFVALALVAPFGIGSVWPGRGDFSPVVLSNFQPWLFGSATVFCLVCAEVWRRLPVLGSSQGPVAATAGAVILAILLVSSAVWPELPEGANEVWAWFARTEQFQSLVAESYPLFEEKGRFSAHMASVRLTGFLFLAPVALFFATRRARGGSGNSPDWALATLVWWTLGLLVATVMQRRFFNSSSVALSLLFALSVHWLLGVGRWNRTLLRAGVTVGVVVGVVALLVPALLSYGVFVRDWTEGLGSTASARERLAQQFATRSMARWLEHNTPPPDVWLSRDEAPEYGVMAPWSDGHLIKYVGRRATVADNFGDDVAPENFELARRYYTSLEPEAAEILEELGVRYVVVAPNPSYAVGIPDPLAMFMSLYAWDGSGKKRVEGEGRVPPLTRHRMVFESRAQAGQDPRLPFYKVYEFVKGAEVSGTAPPGAEVLLRLPIRTHRERTFFYAARSEADASGRYRFRVPYANASADPDLNVDPNVNSNANPRAHANPNPNPNTGSGAYSAAVVPEAQYTLRCGDELANFVVAESDVLEGRSVAGPAVCVGAAPESAEVDGAS